MEMVVSFPRIIVSALAMLSHAETSGQARTADVLFFLFAPAFFPGIDFEPAGGQREKRRPHTYALLARAFATVVQSPPRSAAARPGARARRAAQLQYGVIG